MADAHLDQFSNLTCNTFAPYFLLFKENLTINITKKKKRR